MILTSTITAAIVAGLIVAEVRARRAQRTQVARRVRTQTDVGAGVREVLRAVARKG